MKRIKAACLLQTIHFQLKEDWEHEMALRAVNEEFEHYKRYLQNHHIKYQIVEENRQPDGSLIVKVRKQYNNHSCEEYFHALK